MERFTLEIYTGNAAFEGGVASEVGRILRELARSLEHGDADHTEGGLLDLNGNTVGRWSWRWR